MERSDFVDGWITLGTKMDTKQLERDLKRAETDLKKFEKQMTQLTEKEAKIKAKIEIDKQDYKDKAKELDNKLKNELRANEKNGMIPNEDIIRAKYDEMFRQLEIAQGKRLTKNNSLLDEIHKKMEDNTKEQARLNEEIGYTTQELSKAKNHLNFKSSLENIGNTVQKITKKVIRWGLAIFGVRSAYSFVRQAMSTLSQYDNQLATDIQYIRYALAKTVEPLVKKLSNGYTNY